MDTPRSAHPASNPPNIDDDAQLRAWLKLREEMTELHARLVYLKLMLTLGVRRA